MEWLIAYAIIHIVLSSFFLSQRVSFLPFTNILLIKVYFLHSYFRMNVTTISSSAMSTVATTIVALGTGVVFNNAESLPDVPVDSDLEVSPVTLSSDWPRVARLLLLASLAVVGSVGNVFMISAVMVEDHLRKRGKSYKISIFSYQ